MDHKENKPSPQKQLQYWEHANKWVPQKLYESNTHFINTLDDQYWYYYDLDKRLRRVEKNYVPKQGYVRLKFLERPYRFWRFRSPDGRHSIIPAIYSVIAGVIIYNSSIFFSEWESLIPEKAKLPEDFTKEKLKEYLKEKQKVLKWKEQQQLSLQQQNTDR